MIQGISDKFKRGVAIVSATAVSLFSLVASVTWCMQLYMQHESLKIQRASYEECRKK